MGLLATNKNINFRYIDMNTPIKIAMRNAPSSRKHQYYTRYMPQISTYNVLWGWTNDTITPYDISERCSIIDLTVKEACTISSVLNIPLVISINEFCNINEKSLIEEVYFWRTPKISQKV